MILRDSLGGNARTMMIAAIGPADYNFMETMSTLRYAERAKKIENKPKVNMDPKDALLMKYQEELAALQAQLNGGGGPIGGQAKSDEERLKEMEDQLAKQRKQLENASKMAKEERVKLEKALQQQKAAIDSEKEKRSKYEERLKELSKYAVIGDLKKQTEQNEAQIREYKERLKQRESKAKKLQKEIEERQKRRETVIEKCDNIQAEVEQVNNMFKSKVEQYQNLKLKMPEVQKTIQADRENMASNIDFLNRQIELYTKIIDNFIPEKEVENIRNSFVYNESKNQWSKKEMDKRELVSKVTKLERPKSAYGVQRPSASAKDDMPTIQLSPKAVKSRLKTGSTQVQGMSVEEAVNKAFQDKAENFTYTVNKSKVESDSDSEFGEGEFIEDDFVQ
ncbi:hypothetical protein TRFO_32156 [Tritrichomonas foetus]|uniref:Kinesin motor domain-containing protein n=1 Tax=Tritrichomonas foetus TaxID=1144522 RepID=A0A1J4JU00_9EUKA|nr:hypothetical protein TRFO_32156 [Tritrichomonas foetus]|eukprot:OHT00990.1 hypothetical protein TRFO_32156 [Tritrichomonas foetus]